VEVRCLDVDYNIIATFGGGFWTMAFLPSYNETALM
jgi:hypothetical protein